SLSGGRTDRRGSGNPENDPGLSAAGAIHYEYNACVGERPIEALLLSIFLIGGPCARLRRGHEDACNKLAGLDDSFVNQALLRRHVEFAHRYSSLASLRGEL